MLFDIGETLLNFGKVNTIDLFQQGARSSYEYLKSCGQHLGSFKYYCWRNLLSIRYHYLLSNITGNDFDALELIKKIGKKKGVKLDENQWRHLTWLWYEPLRKISQAEPDITETLSRLKTLGLKLGTLSNTFVHSSSLEKHMEQLGILDFFTTRLYSYQFDFRKPDIRIFKAAAESIGEPMENILFVGDRLDKDITPAIKAGMYAVLKAAYTNAGSKIPLHIRKIEHLSELPSLIEKINHETIQN